MSFNPTIEEQVVQASLCMIQTSVDPLSRRQASQFLEQWTKTDGAWEIYAKWLASYRQRTASATIDPNQTATQMLCLTMLQSKIRSELRRSQPPSSWHPSVAALRVELWEYMRQLRPNSPEERALLSSCCICNAAMLVRSSDGMMMEVVNEIRNTSNTFSGNQSFSLPRETQLRLLSSIPGEMESCQELMPPQVTEELSNYVEVVLECIRRGLEEESTMILSACQALKAWTETAHISLSQLDAPTCDGSRTILSTLINILSSANAQTYDTSNNSIPCDELTLEIAARALTDAIMVVSDHCWPTRDVAARNIWTAISQQGFIVYPLQVATRQEWHSASHALASLLSTFVLEHIDDLVSHPADLGLHVLLEIQAHPHTPVALVPLEVWLTVQEIPLSDRHEHWKRPLYRRLVEVLLARISYKESFTDWENELELDSSEFLEFRWMVADVLIGCYFLLRFEMIQILIHQIQSATHWTTSESALHCLAQISKDVCARIKSHASDGTLVAHDREKTCELLLSLLEQLMGSDIQTTYSQNPLLLGAVVNFCGSYSPAWYQINCHSEAIARMLSYLQYTVRALPMESAKAIRGIYISCLAKSTEHGHSAPDSLASSIIVPALKSVRSSMEVVLTTSDEDAMTLVAEGCTRLVVKQTDKDVALSLLFSDLLQPVLNCVGTVVNDLPEGKSSEAWLIPKVQAAEEALLRFMAVIQTIARFCDSTRIPTMSDCFLQHTSAYLEEIERRTFSTPAEAPVFKQWISIYQEMLHITFTNEASNFALFVSTIPRIMQSIERTRDPIVMDYVSSAAENFGGKAIEMDRSLQELLGHITERITGMMETPHGDYELLNAYFDCLQRFLLYCPRALCYNPKFDLMITFAVRCVSAHEEKESTRAALNFLSQLFGWSFLRLSSHATQTLQEAWSTSGTLKRHLLTNGKYLVQSCFAGLSGGSQILRPAFSDCLFAIVQTIVMHATETQLDPADTLSAALNETLIRDWLKSSMVAAASPHNPEESMNIDIYDGIISILINLAHQGPRGRAKAKVLLFDFSHFAKGDLTIESLDPFLNAFTVT